MGDPLRIVLASASPRRSDLLAQLGVRFTIEPSDIDETELPGEDPVAYVRRLAVEKAAVLEGDDGTVVIAADTTVDVDGVILAKPVDTSDARRMLRLLSGRTHAVHTGIAVRRGHLVESAVTSTRVTMVEIDDVHLDWYVATGEPFGKAGAYALQGAGSLLVERVEGSVSNVIGLPLAALDELLGRLGVSLAAIAGRPD
ncbi:MAG: Septum formation protein Maf [Ilumatobacteraceae bacterium]|nr:Septum formation protein Maf [Ilumatobacteraceae bacterium]MCU1386829.1 Septum formation protein Maf [Ilumatobacteraceae bacterium]